MDDSVDERERIFHNAVREYIIWMLLFVLLYVSSYVTICAYRRRAEKEDCYSSDSEDAIVYRISLWLCTFTLAVSAGAVLLLPMSMIANEALLMFPNSYYLQWVNSSLIHGLWNQIFLASNVSLFVLMPFAYLFTESEGFPGSKKGVMSRVYETAVVLALLTVLLCGLAWVASAMLDEDVASKQALFDVWTFYLPYLYSCISLLGVVMLLICTPMGFAILFTVMGEMVVKPKFLRDLAEEMQTIVYEEDTLRRRIDSKLLSSIANGHHNVTELQTRLGEVEHDRLQLEKRQHISSLRRNLGYPLMMLLLLALTGISGMMVAQNTLELLIGIKALPVETKEIALGLSSLSALGPIGAALEIVIILYLMLASVLGFYNLPLFRRLKPRRQDTPMTKIIGNCVVWLVLSSALPVLARTLGITNFDLLGNFGRLEWLGNFHIILTYNGVFAGATALCLVTKFTSSVRQEIRNRLQQAFRREKKGANTSIMYASVHSTPSPNAVPGVSSTPAVNGNTNHVKEE